MLSYFRTWLVVAVVLVAQAAAAEIPLLPSNPDFETAHFAGSGVCASCHNGLRDANGQDVSIERDWATTMMANSARDPLWQAKVATERRRNPQLDDKIGDSCTRCHAPMANVTLRADGAAHDLLHGGTPDPAHPNYDLAMDGVSCTLCHQIRDDGLLGTAEGASGEFSIDLSRRLAYGPKASPAINPMRNMSGFTPVHGAHMSDSAVCGACHDLRTPVLDDNGQLIQGGAHSGFPEQMVYSEWENSAYADGMPQARSCQDCHMPTTDGVKLANRPRWLQPVDDFSRHTFLGANTLMLDLIDRHSEELGATAADFAPAIAAARQNLRQAAEIQIPWARISGSELAFQVGIRNLSGHKLPSGYPSRRVFLHVVVRDARDRIVFESGRVEPDGSIVGVDSDESADAVEPHYQLITSPDQVQVYESIMADAGGNVTYTLLDAAGYAKDNRLTPLGFDKRLAPADVAVHGAAANDEDFDGGLDLVTYQVPLPSSRGRYTVTVELNYQTLAYGFLRDLLRDEDLAEVARFKRMYEATPIRSENIASQTFTVRR